MNKAVMALLSSLCILSSACGLVGYMVDLREKNLPIEEEKEYQIKYKYYLDDVEVSSMPLNKITDENEEEVGGNTENDNTVLPDYSFDKYKCSNNVQGVWNQESWSFEVNKTSDATCMLYFVSNYLSVDVRANNAEINELDELKDRKVMRNGEITYNITPTEGYKYEKVTCTNDAVGAWDEEGKKLTVSNVTKNSVCEISFSIDEYVVEFAVNHGTLTETDKKVKYGEEVTTVITPAEEYVFNKVTCTNNQQATFDVATNKLTISKLSNKTLCTVDFIASTYEIKVNVVNGSVQENTKNVKTGNNASFAISPNEGYTTTNPTIQCTNGQEYDMSNNLFQVQNVSNSTVCTITLKEATNE